MLCHRVEASHWQDVPPEKEDLKDRKNSFVNRHVALSRPCELWLGTPSNTTISTMGMLLNADGHRHNSFALHPRRSHRRYSEQPLQRTRKNLEVNDSNIDRIVDNSSCNVHVYYNEITMAACRAWDAEKSVLRVSSTSVDDEPALDGNCANRMLFIAYYAQCTNKRSPTVPVMARVKSSMQGPLVVDPSWRPESPMR